MKRLFFLVILGLAAAISGVSQTTTANMTAEKAKSAVPASVVKLMEAEMAVRLCGIDPEHESCKGRNPAKETADLYSEILRDPDAAKFLLANVLSSYSELRSGARGAVQVSQAADEASVKMQMVVIAQNQRIIELLEQLLKKK